MLSVNPWSSLLAYRSDPLPPPYYLVIGIGLAIWGCMGLYGWYRQGTRKVADPEPEQHLSPEQQRVRARFQAKPVDKRAQAVTGLLMAAFFIGLYLVISRA